MSVSVSMRDVGTEMTPIASQEQWRSGTPAGAVTPSLSPLCSVPSSPRGGGGCASASSSASASERELRLRTRREIAALGLQLGKMNIASWARKEEGLLAAASPEKGASDIDEEIKRKAFDAPRHGKSPKSVNSRHGEQFFLKKNKIPLDKNFH